MIKKDSFVQLVLDFLDRLADAHSGSIGRADLLKIRRVKEAFDELYKGLNHLVEEKEK